MWHSTPYVALAGFHGSPRRQEETSLGKFGREKVDDDPRPAAAGAPVSAKVLPLQILLRHGERH